MSSGGDDIAQGIVHAASSASHVDIFLETAHLSLVDSQQNAAPHTMPPNKIPDPPRITSQVKVQDITAEFTRAASSPSFYKGTEDNRVLIRYSAANGPVDQR